MYTIVLKAWKYSFKGVVILVKMWKQQVQGWIIRIVIESYGSWSYKIDFEEVIPNVNQFIDWIKAVHIINKWDIATTYMLPLFPNIQLPNFGNY